MGGVFVCMCCEGFEAMTCKGVGKGTDDRRWVRNARKTDQWTVFSEERVAAPGDIYIRRRPIGQCLFGI